MKKNSKTSIVDFENFFKAEPNSKQKAWSLLNEFYHILLTALEDNEISKSQLANTLNISRSAVTQLFKRTPNISLNRISEIAEAAQIALSFNCYYKSKKINIKKSEKTLSFNFNQNSVWRSSDNIDSSLYFMQPELITKSEHQYQVNN